MRVSAYDLPLTNCGECGHLYSVGHATDCDWYRPPPGETDPPHAMLRVILAAGGLWGFRRFADITARVAAIKEP